MKILRVVLVLAVLAYAGWLAWPAISPFLEGPPDTARIQAEAVIDGAPPTEALLWVAAAVLYVVAAILLGAGNPRAAVAYFLGFMADAALRLAIDRHGSGGGDGGYGAGPYADVPYADGMGADIAARSAEAVAPAGLSVDPTWLVLGALLIVGVVIVAISRRRVKRRQPGHLAA